MKQNGAQLIVADPRRIKLSRFARTYLAHKPGTEIALLNGMARVILEEGLEDREFVAAETSGIEELKKSLAQFTPAFVEQATGVSGRSSQLRRGCLLPENALLSSSRQAWALSAMMPPLPAARKTWP